MAKFKVGDRFSNRIKTYKIIEVKINFYLLSPTPYNESAFSMEITRIDGDLQKGYIKKIDDKWDKHIERMLNG